MMSNESADAHTEVLTVEENQLFTAMDGEARTEIARLAQVIDVAEGEMLFDLGEDSNDLYLVLSGLIWIGRGDGEQKITFATIGPRGFFGEMSFFSPAPRSARAVALTSARVARLDRAAVEHAVELAPVPFTQNLVSAFIDRVRASNEDRVEEVLRQERLHIIGRTVLGIVHDLKNPINVVQGVASVLEDGILLSDMHGRLRRAAESMTGMLEGLLAFARGDAGLRVRLMRLSELLLPVEEQALEGLERRGVQVERHFDSELLVSVDPDRIVRALLNVIRNASEVMPNGGRLTLTVQNKSAEAIFTISDTGGGIPEDLIPTLFQPFVTRGKAGGTGLGMAITKSFVEAHGGRIVVENAPGKGATFVIYLPQPPSGAPHHR